MNQISEVESGGIVWTIAIIKARVH
jgi:hypothetical protein